METGYDSTCSVSEFVTVRLVGLSVNYYLSRDGVNTRGLSVPSCIFYSKQARCIVFSLPQILCLCAFYLNLCLCTMRVPGACGG